jgi:hypothetical protein
VRGALSPGTEGNYRLEITADPGAGQVLKSNLFKVGTETRKVTELIEVTESVKVTKNTPYFDLEPTVQWQTPLGGYDTAASMQRTTDGGYQVLGVNPSGTSIFTVSPVCVIT